MNLSDNPIWHFLNQNRTKCVGGGVRFSANCTGGTGSCSHEIWGIAGRPCRLPVCKKSANSSQSAPRHGYDFNSPRGRRACQRPPVTGDSDHSLSARHYVGPRLLARRSQPQAESVRLGRGLPPVTGYWIAADGSLRVRRSRSHPGPGGVTTPSPPESESPRARRRDRRR